MPRTNTHQTYIDDYLITTDEIIPRAWNVDIRNSDGECIYNAWACGNLYRSRPDALRGALRVIREYEQGE